MNLIPRNSFFHDMFGYDNNNFLKDSEFMNVDIYKKGKNYVLEMDLPGIKKEDINVELDNGYLTITAIKEESKEEKDEYVQQERFYGEMKRSFYVGDIKEDSIKGTFKDGTLKVTFPKEENVDAKKQISID